MSALPPKADIGTKPRSSASEQRLRYVEAERLGSRLADDYVRRQR